ncbi:MAG: glycosyltransferase family 2 protein [Chitinophagaceae bacterium]|nr:glycosyltransferase family 2 protein [Chitinophagaceae bacterium]
MLLSVIIVSYNAKYFLEHCLLSVLKAGRNITMEVIVVDNHSIDNSRDYLQPAFPQVKFTWLNDNIGFGKACNLGLMQATGQYILFLNPDTIVPEDCFEKCIGFSGSQPHAGGLGVRMTDGRGVFLKESKRGFPSLWVSLLKLSGIGSLFPRSRFFAGYYMGHLPENEINKIDILSGAFMFIPARVLQVTGGFDEAFFMYGEDIDLSFRIQKAGYENYYYPDITIVHFKGESTVKTSRKYVYTFYNAMRIFIRKHYPYFLSVLYSFLVTLAMLAAAIITTGRNVFNRRTQITDSQTPESFVINGTEEELENVKPILLSSYGKQGGIQLYKMPEMKTGRRQETRDMIICEGFFSFKEIIRKLPLLATLYRVWFHADKSRSIITSDSKDGRGITIPAE